METNRLTRIILFGVFIWFTVSCASKTSNISYDKDLYLVTDEILGYHANEYKGDIHYWEFQLELSAQAFLRLQGYAYNSANIGKQFFLTNKVQAVSLTWISPYSDFGNNEASIMINSQGARSVTIICFSENTQINVQDILY